MGFFLVKEIWSNRGVLHFQRFRLLQTKWFAIYLHRILASDEDKHLHDHPFSFISLILKGAYREVFARSPNWATPKTRDVKAGRFVRHDATDAHKLTLLTKSVWSLVIAFNFQPDWGYQTEQGWMDHWLYRQRKHARML